MTTPPWQRQKKDTNSTQPEFSDKQNVKQKGDATENSRRYSTAYTVDTDGNMDSLFNGQEQDNSSAGDSLNLEKMLITA